MFLNLTKDLIKFYIAQHRKLTQPKYPDNSFVRFHGLETEL